MIFADRILETSTSTGTGNFTLAGAKTAFRTFNTGFGTGSVPAFYYSIVSVDGNGNATGPWEIGRGHLSAATTLVRDVVVASSNSNSLVDFSAGSKNVFANVPAQKANFSGAVAILNGAKTGIDFHLGAAVSWDAVSLDTDSYWSAGSATRLTVPTDGKYVFTAAAKLANLTTGEWMRAYVQISGSTSVQGVAFQNAVGSTFPGASLITAPIAMTATQYGELFITTQADTASDVAQYHSWFAVERKIVS